MTIQGFRVTECWYNETTIPYINYWDQVNSWKKVWKFWNGSFCRNKSSRLPYSLLQYIGRVATWKFVPRNCLRYNIDNGEKGLVPEFMWGIALFFIFLFIYLFFWWMFKFFYFHFCLFFIYVFIYLLFLTKPMYIYIYK